MGWTGTARLIICTLENHIQVKISLKKCISHSTLILEFQILGCKNGVFQASEDQYALAGSYTGFRWLSLGFFCYMFLHSPFLRMLIHLKQSQCSVSLSFFFLVKLPSNIYYIHFIIDSLLWVSFLHTCLQLVFLFLCFTRQKYMMEKF